MNDRVRTTTTVNTELKRMANENGISLSRAIDEGILVLVSAKQEEIVEMKTQITNLQIDMKIVCREVIEMKEKYDVMVRTK